MNHLASIPAPQTFGTLLKHWRLARRMSQLALALEAEISVRHLSFLETGRALPSRDMVLLLATMLDVPLRERNALLHPAGEISRIMMFEAGEVNLGNELFGT